MLPESSLRFGCEMGRLMRRREDHLWKARRAVEMAEADFPKYRYSDSRRVREREREERLRRYGDFLGRMAGLIRP